MKMIFICFGMIALTSCAMLPQYLREAEVIEEEAALLIEKEFEPSVKAPSKVASV